MKSEVARAHSAHTPHEQETRSPIGQKAAEKVGKGWRACIDIFASTILAIMALEINTYLKMLSRELGATRAYFAKQ
jgi:hypothetical protein